MPYNSSHSGKISVFFTFILFAACLLLVGCGTPLFGALTGGPSYNLSTLSPGTKATSKQVQDFIPTVCSNLLNITPDAPIAAPQQIQRNGCIFAYMNMIDQSYYIYRRILHDTVDTGNTLTDIIGIGLGSAGGLAPSAATKSILAVISAGLFGVQAKINSDILYSNAIAIILAQMDADRADWKSRILIQINDSKLSKNYTMYQAADDLLAYYEAGTWDHALQALYVQSSKNLENCQAAVKAAQTTGNTGSSNQDSSSNTSNASVNTSCGPVAASAGGAGNTSNVLVHHEK